MKYLHTMVRVVDIERSLAFYCDALGLEELNRYENEGGRFTLVFLAAPGDSDAQVELTYNWDSEALAGVEILVTWPIGWTISIQPASAYRTMA